jgi:hypothetical protein
VRVEDGDLAVALERKLPGEALIEDAAERVDVGPAVERAALDLLGGRVVEGSDEMPGAREPRARCRVLRDAEVGQIDVVGAVGVDPGGDDDVARLDVAMDQSLRVRGVERGGHLAEHVQSELRTQLLLLLEPGLEVDPVHVAHGDEEDALGFAGLVDRNDVRVVDRGREMRLPFEPLTEAGVVCELGRQDLERDLPLEPFLHGSVDDAHTAAADKPFDPVSGELRPDPRVGVDTHG